MAYVYIPYEGPTVTRANAKSLDLKRYHSGKPCKHGHYSERHTINGRCIACLMLSASETPQAKSIRTKKQVKKGYFVKYYHQNKDKIAQYKQSASYRASSNLRAKERYARNTERCKNWIAAWRSKNPNYSREWRSRNPNYNKIIYARNRNERVLRSQNRRARCALKLTDIHNKLGEQQNWKCPDCQCCIRNKNHLDHIMPLALGGGHVESNLRLTCPTCNMKKGAMHPDKWAKRLGKVSL